MSEDTLIARIVARLRASPSEDVSVGAGDDAAVLALAAGSNVVLSVDAHVEGVHFERAWLSDEQCGYRAVMAATSDLAAMGARARAALIAIAAPAGTGEDVLFALFEGCVRAAESARMHVIGGNLTRARDLSVTTTVVGESRAKVLRRSGARVGDGIYVTGDLGLAALGRAILAHERRDALEREPAGELAVMRYRAPLAKLVQGERLTEFATACIDVSDGLAKDAERLGRASEVRLRIAAHTLPTSREAESMASQLGLKLRDLALGGGDDYELLYTAPASGSSDQIGTRIGQVVEGEPGVEVHDEHDRPIEAPSGWDHFRG